MSIRVRFECPTPFARVVCFSSYCVWEGERLSLASPIEGKTLEQQGGENDLLSSPIGKLFDNFLRFF